MGVFVNPFPRRKLPRALRLGKRLVCIALLACGGTGQSAAVEPEVRRAEHLVVDATTLKRKVLCGYQGWFRCPGDGTRDGWLHWSRTPRTMTPESLTVEMWPEMTEYGEAERYVVPGFGSTRSEPTTLFSSANQRTVERHFEWMQEYGIDGVFVQRFLVNLSRPSFDLVLNHIRQSAEQSGRIYAVCYDLSGAPEARLYDQIVNDWKRLVDEERITSDDHYLHHDGKPLLYIWGFFSDRFDASIAHQIIDFFKGEHRYGVTLVGGCPWSWRKESDAEWARVYRRFDVISPWNVGNYTVAEEEKRAATGSWEEDFAEAQRHGMEFLPVVYPGFGWTNLKGQEATNATIPRRSGAFYWEQFVEVSRYGIPMAYVAMFDEVDEATAIFKVSNTPPDEAQFQTFEGLPSDWYLRLTGEGTKVIRGEQEATASLPIAPEEDAH